LHEASLSRKTTYRYKEKAISALGDFNYAFFISFSLSCNGVPPRSFRIFASGDQNQMIEQSKVEQPKAHVHGAKQHATVTIDTYNAELRDAEGFIGDKASNRAFRSILEDWRERLREVGDDPLGDQPTLEISKKKLDKVLIEGDIQAAGLLQSVIEEFAQELAKVTHRLLKLKSWRDTQCIVVGGGFRASRIGELAIGRAAILLKTEYDHDIDFKPIRHDPDEAGLIGNLHLIPAEMFDGYDSMLGIDIGGSNIRAGIVELKIRKDGSFCDAQVCSSDLWRHADETVKRDEAVERLAKMTKKLIADAHKQDLSLAPFIGIGCPGLIGPDGSIEKGGQNLPGNWESSRFNLPKSIQDLIPEIGENTTVVMMHNDAVVQGLSETPWMTQVKHWGALTIGTGLGNARFTNAP